MPLFKNLARIFGRARGNSVLPIPVDPSIQAAQAQHQAGRLSEAEAIYRHILAYDPNHVNALQGLGAIAQQRGNAELASKLLTQAIAIFPTPLAYNNLGVTYRSLNRLDDAQGCFRNALKLQPDYAEALNNLGIIYREKGDYPQAVVYFRKALALRPNHFSALNNLGTHFQEQGELGKAEELFRAALAQKPSAETLTNLGSILMGRDNIPEAEKLYRLALNIKPEYAHAHNAIGLIHLNRGETILAEKCFRSALASNPDLAEANSNMGEALRLQGQLKEAEKFCRKALFSNPELVDAHTNLSLILSEGGHVDEAETFSRNALALKPNDPTLCWNLALLLLLRGNYQEGWQLYENRLARSHPHATGGTAIYRQFHKFPAWQGEDLAGKRILIWTEQGLGDALMILRYLPFLRRKGATQILVYCHPTLQRLIETIPSVDLTIPFGLTPSFAAFDLHCPSMSLPFLSRLDSIPNNVPYIYVPKQLVADWAHRVPQSSVNIGLAWGGSKIFQKDNRRSIPLRRFEPLLRLKNIRLFSLQKDESAAQLDELGWNILNFMDDCQDLMDTAALMMNLDIIISVDTAVAHLAGAIGKPVWLLNRHESEWRWGLERKDSPWYPTMRIFRQSEPFEWDTVMQRIAAELEKFAVRPGSR